MNKAQLARAVAVDIQQFFATGVLPSAVSDSELAEKYTAFCQAAYDRLDRCNQLLDGSKYSEALRLEQETPPLLDLIDILTFPQLGMWLSYCKERNFSLPRRFDPAWVARINDAYAKVQETFPIERSLRRSAMQRPPDLYGCIQALRRLNKAQPEVAYWKDDLLLFEKRRLEQLDQAFDAAMEAQDLAQASAILSELSNDWQKTELCLRVTATVRDGVERLQEQAAFQQAGRLVEALNTARMANAFSEVGIYLEQYRQVSAAGHLKASAEMVEVVSSIDAWYSQECERRERSEKMRGAIERLGEFAKDPRVRELKEMRRLRNLVFGTNLDELPEVCLPEDLPPKVASAISHLERLVMMRRILIGAISAAILLLLSGTAFYLIQAHTARKLATYYTGALQAAFDARDASRFTTLKGDLEKTALINKLKLFPELQAVLNKGDKVTSFVEKARQTFTDRLAALAQIAETGYLDDAAFSQALSEAETLRTGFPILRDDPRCLEQLTQHREARQSFWTSRLLDAERTLLAHADAADQLTEQLAANLFGQPQTNDETVQKIRQALADASAAKEALKPLLDKQVSSPSLQLTAAKVEAVEKKAAAQLERARACAEQRALIEGAKTLPDYLSALETYAKNFAEDQRTAAFAQTLSGRAHFEQFTAWTGEPLDTDNLESVFRRAAGIPPENAYWYPVLTQYVSPFKRAVPVWEKVSDAAFRDPQSWKNDLILTDLYEIQFRLNDAKGTFISGFARGGKRTAGQAGEPIYEVDVYVPREADTQEEFKVLRAKADRINAMTLMPHCQFMKRLIQQIRDLPPAQAPAFLLRTIQELRDTKLMSSELLRLRIIDYFAAQAIEVYTAERMPELVKLMEAKAKLDTDKRPWLCTSNRAVLKTNDEARRLLASLRGVDLGAGVNREAAVCRACLERGARWVGFASPFDGAPVLARDQEGEVWVLRPDASGLPIPVIASEDGKRFGLALNPGECLFAPAPHKTGSTRLLRLTLGQQLNAPVTDADLPLVWPREHGQLVQGAAAP